MKQDQIRKPKNNVSKKVLELSILWLRGEVTTTEVQRRTQAKCVNTAVYRMGIGIRQAYRDGLLKLQ